MKKVHRREFLKTAAVSGTAAILSPAHLATSGPRRRKLNVLFIMTDQHNARALGCYGNKEVKTPNMDRLAREGVLFRNAFCQTAQCCPSRYSIWTGRYARSHGLYFNGMMENPKERTVGELFKAAGYVTGTIGKHHMHMSTKNGNHGFDVVVVHADRAFAKKGKFLPYDRVHPGRANVGESDVPNARHPAGMNTAAAVKFLREHKDKPFCLWYSFHGPHTPICPSRPWARQYDPREITLPPNNKYNFDFKQPGLRALQKKSGELTEDDHRRTLAYYYGLVSQIDYNIGRVLDELDKLGLADNTVVVYTADHGEMMSEHGSWTKGRTGYEATLHVPLLLRLPGVLPAGRRRTELVGSIDLLPTLLDLAGLDIPAAVQGRSLVPLVKGTASSWRKVILSELGASTKTTCIAVRGADHKYVLYRNNGQTAYEQLFDLKADPWERKNEVGNPRYAAALAKLKQALEQMERTIPAAPPGQRKPRRPRRR